MARRITKTDNEPMGFKKVKKETERQIQLAHSAEKRLETALLDIKDAEKRRDAIEKEIDAGERALDRTKSDIDQIDKDISEKMKTRNRIEKEIESHEKVIKDHKEKAHKIIKKAEENAGNIISVAECKAEELQTKECRLKADITTANDKLSETNKAIKCAVSGLNEQAKLVNNKSQELKRVSENFDKKTQKLNDIENEITRHATTLSELKDAKKSIIKSEEALKNIDSKIITETATLNTLMQKQSDVEAKMQEKINENRNLIKALEVKERSVKRLIEEEKTKHYLKSLNV